MNGGTRLAVEGQRVDLLYREIDVVQHVDEAEAGRCEVDPVEGYVGGKATNVLARELTLAEVLAGQVAATGVSRRASAGRAPSLAAQRRLFVCDRPHGGGTPRRGLVGLLAKAAIEAAQAALAGRGEWALTEKAIVRRAALGARVEAILAAPGDRAFDAPAARDARRAPRVHRAGAGRGGGRALRPVIGRRFLLERAAAAHATIETRATVGKTLLEVGPAS